jgi:N utilization substance protein B
MGAGVRRRGRWYALQVLYALDVEEALDVDTASRAVDGYAGAFELEIDERSVAFARELVTGTVERLPEVDDMVQSASRNWRVARMARVDRNILRIAAYELRHAPEVPVKVVINEAVELAKRFGAADAPAFVNGLLDRIAQNARRKAD